MPSDAPSPILDFWFAPENRARWFTPDPEFDRTLRERFEDDLLAAAAAPSVEPGSLPEALARCLLLDQLPRNIYRRTPRAFAYDRLARASARLAAERGLDRDAEPAQCLFLYLPFEHSEDLEDQRRSVELFRKLGDADWLHYAEAHAVIIERFGRFPHRNAILGRPSTAEELAFLQEPGSSF